MPPTSAATQILGEVESMIETGGGRSSGRTTGARRRMTFEIDHRPEADYHLFQFEGDRDAPRPARPHA